MANIRAVPFAWVAVLVTGPSLVAQVPATWQSRGVGGGGAFYSPSINPANDNEYYVASDMSGLYRTTDFGNSYSVANFKQVQGGHESAVRFTNNPLIAYTVTYTGGNNAMPAKTTDGGATWAVLPGNPRPHDDIYSIWTDYNNPSQPDLLWQNRATGQRSVWYMNGTTLVSGENLWMVEPDSDLVGVREINRGGSVDLVWQHRISGQRSA